MAPAESVPLGIDGPFVIGPASDGEGAGGGLRLIRRIELRNYMSHRHTVIDLAEGLTVLVGPNNCGKSAVVSAFQTLCQNATGDYMRRHGERECSVRVETDDGHVLEWRRKRDGVSYTLDGQEVSRLNGSPPDDLHDLLRLPLVESGNTSFDVHFGEQKQPIFLLDKSSGHRATFFASSSDAVKLIAMQRLHGRMSMTPVLGNDGWRGRSPNSIAGSTGWLPWTVSKNGSANWRGSTTRSPSRHEKSSRSMRPWSICGTRRGCATVLRRGRLHWLPCVVRRNCCRRRSCMISSNRSLPYSDGSIKRWGCGGRRKPCTNHHRLRRNHAGSTRSVACCANCPGRRGRSTIGPLGLERWRHYQLHR